MTDWRETAERVTGSELTRRVLALLIELIEALGEGLQAIFGTLPVL